MLIDAGTGYVFGSESGRLADNLHYARIEPNNVTDTEHIKYRLSMPYITLSDIIDEFNFSSAQHFNSFCKPVITGVIHTVYALLLGKEDVAEMIRDGLINSTGDNYSRAFTLWFLVCGIILILWGQTLQYCIKKEQKPAPLFLEYCILFLL